jgi:hypothetical protein
MAVASMAEDIVLLSSAKNRPKEEKGVPLRRYLASFFRGYPALSGDMG